MTNIVDIQFCTQIWTCRPFVLPHCFFFNTTFIQMLFCTFTKFKLMCLHWKFTSRGRVEREHGATKLRFFFTRTNIFREEKLPPACGSD